MIMSGSVINIYKHTESLIAAHEEDPKGSKFITDNPQVAERIFSFLSFKDLHHCRCLNKNSWNIANGLILKEIAKVYFNLPGEKIKKIAETIYLSSATSPKKDSADMDSKKFSLEKIKFTEFIEIQTAQYFSIKESHLDISEFTEQLLNDYRNTVCYSLNSYYKIQLYEYAIDSIRSNFSPDLTEELIGVLKSLAVFEVTQGNFSVAGVILDFLKQANPFHARDLQVQIIRVLPASALFEQIKVFFNKEEIQGILQFFSQAQESDLYGLDSLRLKSLYFLATECNKFGMTFNDRTQKKLIDLFHDREYSEALDWVIAMLQIVRKHVKDPNIIYVFKEIAMMFVKLDEQIAAEIFIFILNLDFDYDKRYLHSIINFILETEPAYSAQNQIINQVFDNFESVTSTRMSLINEILIEILDDLDEPHRSCIASLLENCMKFEDSLNAVDSSQYHTFPENFVEKISDSSNWLRETLQNAQMDIVRENDNALEEEMLQQALELSLKSYQQGQYHN